MYKITVTAYGTVSPVKLAHYFRKFFSIRLFHFASPSHFIQEYSKIKGLWWSTL